jgi:hypothetical protein
VQTEFLCKLAEDVGRPLSLVVRGGADVLPLVSRSFSRVAFLDTTAFMKTVKRKSGVLTEMNRVTWKAVKDPTLPLDELLEHNYLTMARLTGTSDPKAR